MGGGTAEAAPTLGLTSAAIQNIELSGLAYTADSKGVLKAIGLAGSANWKSR